MAIPAKNRAGTSPSACAGVVPVILGTLAINTLDSLMSLRCKIFPVSSNTAENPVGEV
jgi:hypothetical protein